MHETTEMKYWREAGSDVIIFSQPTISDEKSIDIHFNDVAWYFIDVVFRQFLGLSWYVE